MSTIQTKKEEGSAAARHAVINVAEMPYDMQTRAIELTNEALDRHREGTPWIEKDVAHHVKREFDAQYGPTWHCVFGRSFGAEVCFEARKLLHCTVGQHHLLLWKHT
eukprot:TRINITY_DN47158_c0_g1_i1.p2 TRINITY_DN47158_c0_g1~~TRINITY_DN47158_c0_g1_i1.p2  ORF type:complete len:107 (+),score=12.95 TRINITY_DN47158_c0_g1_i1:153-473(+)